MSNSAPAMPSPLQAILEAELAAGNEVAEVSSWPPKCSLLVILRHPFNSKHTAAAGVEFAEINDSHYWKAEYRYNGGAQVLACGFK
ncbi:hypothetical protein [Piscinibacter sp. XHJ-5]|uniref:hypothetical protein n=1 Tax=Piscinibacter sp. XHJ-5 TaxID=3037797 RepID=UPI0024530FE0|nr:hypothetical protein [Piscinibacter sp. XHJ-5]